MPGPGPRIPVLLTFGEWLDVVEQLELGDDGELELADEIRLEILEATPVPAENGKPVRAVPPAPIVGSHTTAASRVAYTAKSAVTRDVPADAPEDTTPRQQRFLDAAATLATLGAEVTRNTVAAWLGLHPRGGSVGEKLKALEGAGYIVNDRGRITVTEAGLAVAGYIDPQEAIDRATSGLSPRQTSFFGAITAAYPDDISRAEIAEQFGLHPRGGSLGDDLRRLVNRGLVEGSQGRFRAKDFLFIGADV